MTAAMNLVMKASEPTDTELVRRLLDGDKEAFVELYQRRHGNIYRFALHMTGRPEMADDVAQETFMVLINNSAVYDETKGAVNSFLLGIARNQVLRRLRQERPTVPVDECHEEIDRGAYQITTRDGRTDNVNRQDLGTQVIEGVPATGTRITFTIPAGQIGNERPIEIVDERWFSKDLQAFVMTKHSDPRSGETVYRLTDISRTEPDRSLFEVPADYQLKESTSFPARTRKPE